MFFHSVGVVVVLSRPCMFAVKLVLKRNVPRNSSTLHQRSGTMLIFLQQEIEQIIVFRVKERHAKIFFLF